MNRMSSCLPEVPTFLRGEPGRNMLLIFTAIVVVVSFGDILLPLVVLYAAGFVGGMLASWLKQPPLVGMLIAGCLVRNALPSQVGLPLTFFSDGLRSGALGLIMLRAGLGLEIDALLSQPLRLGLLAAIPCFAEVAAVVFLAQYAFGFDWRWGTLLGFCLADVSPAVTVPLLLDLQRQGRGAKRGIPSILIAAASLNAVIAIVGFGVALKLIFAGGDHTSPWIRSFRSIALGFGEITVGLFLGATTGWIFSIALETAVLDPRDRRPVPFLSSTLAPTSPPNSHRKLPTFVRPENSDTSARPSSKYRFHEDIFDESKYISSNTIAKRAAKPFAFALSSVAAMAIVTGKYLHVYGAGALTAVVLGLAVKVAAASGDRESYALSECEKILNGWWNDYGVISLFALLGAAIDLDEVDPTIVLYAAGLVSLALLPRAIAAYFCSSGESNVCCCSSPDAISQEEGMLLESSSLSSSSSKWTHREKLFAAVAWCPKATVQAALSTVAIDTVLMLQKSHQYDSLTSLNQEPEDDITGATVHTFEQDYQHAHIVLTVAVVSIFWTCLPFAGLITTLGPVLLDVDDEKLNSSQNKGGSMLEEEEESDEDDKEDDDGAHSSDSLTSVAVNTSYTKAEDKEEPVLSSTGIQQEQEAVASSNSSERVEVEAMQSKKATSALKLPISSSPNKLKKQQQSKSSHIDDVDLLGIGPNVPVISPPKINKNQAQRKFGNGRFLTNEEKAKYNK